jgi:fumarate reductase flavoprotein subunit
MKENSTESTKTDLVVIGSGVSGLASSVIAAEGGLKVMLFEKQLSLGGSSNFFEGLFAAESKMQKERYIDYTRDQAFKNIMEYSHWRANPRLVRAIVDESAWTIQWLQKQGVVFTGATINMPGAPHTYHVVKGH